MATCDASTIVLPDMVAENSELSIVEKLRTLTEESLGTSSIYMRAKDTFKELFDGHKISEPEYAQLASQFISNLAVQTTQSVMQGAIDWAKAEKEMAYGLAQSRANVELTLAQIEKLKYDICNAQKDNELKCAQVTATVSSSIRDNGRVATWDANNSCMPLTLMDEGVKFDQKAVYQAQTYTALADAFRKSGKVQIGVDVDNTTKGLSGDNMGYTDAQEEFARRQVKSFEDSKRQHAVNAISAMIGQMLSAEVAPTAEDISRWRTALDYLLTPTA